MTRYFLLADKRSLKGFAHQSDRDYFARPVLVEPLYCDVSTRHVYVRDPARNCQFPALAAEIKPDWRLSKKQLARA